MQRPYALNGRHGGASGPRGPRGRAVGAGPSPAARAVGEWAGCRPWLRRLRAGLLRLLLVVLAGGWIQPAAAGAGDGTLLLVGDVLRYNHPTLWQYVAGRGNQGLMDFSIIAAANDRARLYGGFAARALERYGINTSVVPLAESPGAFGVTPGQAVADPYLADAVRAGRGIFFVGGAPQRLSRVLLEPDGTPTTLGQSVIDAHAAGGMVVGGIPGHAGVHTGYEALRALAQGRVEPESLYRGLGLVPEGWYVDQHFFSPGRFAEALVAMHQLGLRYGLGVGVDAAAVIEAGYAEVLGEGPVMVIDLSGAVVDEADGDGFGLQGARLSLLDRGDRFDMGAKQAILDPSKREGFELRPTRDDSNLPARCPPEAPHMFARGRLVQLMHQALDGGTSEAVGVAFPDDGAEDHSGFRFHFHAGPDSAGRLALDGAGERVTLLHVRLDIEPCPQTPKRGRRD